MKTIITLKNKIIFSGWVPQWARSVLLNSLKTEIVITGNMREWRHFFDLRLSPKAHPQMQGVAKMIWHEMHLTELEPFIREYSDV